MNGYAKSSEISFGTYTVVETKFPPNYQAGDKNSWSVTLDSNHVTVVLDVANERQSGNLKVLKNSEDGKITGCIFALTGTDVYGRKVNMTATTDANGVALFENVPIGTGYTLEEKYTPDIYVIPEKQTVDVKANEIPDMNKYIPETAANTDSCLLTSQSLHYFYILVFHQVPLVYYNNQTLLVLLNQ